jgi:hypothetical protein
MTERITNQEMDRVGAWLEAKTNATCPFCAGRVWTVDDELGSLPALQRTDPRVRLDRGYTFVLVTCEQCGFTAPFAAKKIGMVGAADEPSPGAG